MGNSELSTAYRLSREHCTAGTVSAQLLRAGLTDATPGSPWLEKQFAGFERLVPVMVEQAPTGKIPPKASAEGVKCAALLALQYVLTPDRLEITHFPENTAALAGRAAVTHEDNCYRPYDDDGGTTDPGPGRGDLRRPPHLEASRAERRSSVGRRKRHHTVTRILLEGFSERGQVTTRVREGREFAQSIRHATVVSDFYSFDNEGNPDDAVEGWLADVVEGGFHCLLPGLRRGEQPTSEMRPSIARFVATAVIRTRTARSYMDQIDHHTAGSTVLLKVAPELGWDLADMSTDEVRRLRDLCQGAWESLPPRPDHAASNLRVVVRESRRIEGALLRYVWSVATTSEPSFLIGDAPVLSLSGQQSGWHGLVPKGATLFLPLSAQAVLVGEPHVFGRSFSADRLVRTVNALTAHEAYEAVFRHPGMLWPSGVLLGPQPPRLPEPSFSVSRSEPGRPATFPYRYPEMDDEETKALLEYLGAVDVVE